MLKLYRGLMGLSAPVLKWVLKRRQRRGKEDPDRLSERMGLSPHKRPRGTLVWFHAASVGESQSTLILIDALLKERPNMHILVTTGTVTSAQLMKKRLPEQALHQYYPLDHPRWINRFLDYWRPDLILWMESELWPNMLMSIQTRGIPAALLNARLSRKSFDRWRRFSKSAKKLLDTFRVTVAQSSKDKTFFEALGAENVLVGDNLKYAAAALPCDDRELDRLQAAIKGRPRWVYASTHAGEEEMAARIHSHLKKEFPGLLTIIVPRHPERRQDVKKACETQGVTVCMRGRQHKAPKAGDDIYIGDTLGELGLFYRLAPIACIGRSLSDDGGGGHNPIEAAQLECAIMHGPWIQNLAEIYKDMDQAGAALKVMDERDLQSRLAKLLRDDEGREALQNKALTFVRQKAAVKNRILDTIMPWLPAPQKDTVYKSETA